MLFLKQIRAHGFKSFADPTTLDFNNDMIGVVGPNGSGKSNITDAIRWTLGEQSMKSLRGGSSDDVVFAGSVDRPGLDHAEVTLVFDNEKKVFSTIESDIIEITRRFSKKTRENEFFINGDKVKMRDVQDIALETGLTKSSIAIISQGTISTFAEAKPDQRREIFDEAAGVAKYKKRKRETTVKLLKALENLSRIDDISAEIGRRLPNLERQAKKALSYREKITELQQIEVTILAQDIKIFKVKIDELRNQKGILEEKVKNLSNEINYSQEEFDKMINETSSSEKTLTELNNKFNELVTRVGSLKVKKVEAETRENVADKNSGKDEIRTKQIKKEYDEKRITLQSEKDKQNRLSNKITELKERYDYLSSEYENTYNEIESVRRNLTRLTTEKEFMERQKSINNFSGPAAGANQVIAHAANIGGVIGTLLSLVRVQEKYQTAISVVGAGSMFSVVMKTTDDVKRAIEFLKKNQAGRATFLPLDSLNPSTIQGPQRTAIEQLPGFIGFANDLVEINSEYQKALDYALGTIIVVENYDLAISMAKNINYRFNIVTLEGERILPHGAIVGGKTKSQNIFGVQNQGNSVEDLDKTIVQLEQKEVERTKILNDLKIERDKLRDEIGDIQSAIRNSQQLNDQIRVQMNDLSDDYRIITGKSLNENEQSNTGELESIKISREIARLELQRDEIQIEINSLSSNKNKYADRQRELNEQNNFKRDELSTFKDELANVMADLSALHVRNVASLQKLAETYGLTEQAALEMEIKQFDDEQEIRQRIIQLTTEIKEIGNVNMDSIEEYDKEKQRYDYYEEQAKEIRESVAKLESIISDIDIAMETQFKKVIDDVNEALPDAFQKLFGGGTAKLIYTLPDNILETGIDIDVNPPGKKISNLNLLSGGEKSLVALSVLFSILKARPLPLVILDEAEAPLDPANVERFARYVKQFTVNTQFIIVTHREGTMENCDVLFGVTMETKGITKIVKIKLVDAKILAIQDQE